MDKKSLQKAIQLAPCSARILFCHNHELPSEIAKSFNFEVREAGYKLQYHQYYKLEQIDFQSEQCSASLIFFFITRANSTAIIDFLNQHTQQQDCPKIVLIGEKPGEEQVADAIRAGAANYLDIHNLDRLKTLLSGLPHSPTETGALAASIDTYPVDIDILLNSLLNTVTDGILITDQRGNIRYLNPVIEALYQEKAATLSGRKLIQIFSNPGQLRFKQFIDKYTKPSPESFNDAEATGLRQDGSSIPVRIFVHEIRMQHQRFHIIIMLDLTQQKQIEEKLVDSHRLWNYAMNFSEDAIYLLDLERRIIQANNGFYRLINAPGKNYIGRLITDIIHPDGEKSPCPICKAQKELRDMNITMEASNPANPYSRPIQVICKIIHDETNRPSSILMTIRDLSRIRELDQKICISEANLAEAQRISNTGNWVWDIQGNQLDWSNQVFRLFDLSQSFYTPTYASFITFVHPDDRQKVQEAVNDALYLMKPYSIDHRIVLPDGSIRFVHEQAEVRFDDEANPLRMSGTIQDITERILAEKALRKNETLFRATFEQAAVGLAHVSLQGNFLRVNQRLCDILGFSRQELLQLNFKDITHPDDIRDNLEHARHLVEQRIKSYSKEKRYLTKDNSILWVNLTVSVAHKNNHQPDFFISVMEDITERKSAQLKVIETLHEKEALLRELHHRVKNNMQIISSMISLQLRQISDHSVRDNLNDTRQRIRTMALVHDHLYSSGNLASINFQDYLKQLCKRITSLYEHGERKVIIDLSGEAVQLPIDQALPIALISNELIVNSIKHAYYKHMPHHIEISLMQDQHSIALVVRDFGKGFNYKVMNQTDSLGLTIINALTQQIAGKIDYDSSQQGTTVTLRIKATTVGNKRLN